MLIDLSANESAYNCSIEAIKNIDKCFETVNKYLEFQEFNLLIKEISDYCETDENRIIVGSGTDNLIQKVVLKFFKDRDLVVFNPNFNRTLNLAKDLGMKIRRIQLNPPEFKVNWKSMKTKDSIVIIDYPNNPTGKFLINKEELEEILENNNIVLIDEAGYEYSKKTFIDLVKKYENLAITRTFDKAFGLAGLKVSYMIMGNAILEKIDRGVDINKPAFVGALEVLKDQKYTQKCVLNMLNERKFIEESLKKVGLKVYKSEGNFLLVQTKISDFSLRLREKGILIEDLSRFWLDGYYRISIGNREENKKLIEEIKILILS